MPRGLTAADVGATAGGRAALIKIGVDPTGVKVGVEQAKKAWDDYINHVNTGTTKMQVATTASDRMIQTLGKTRIAYSPMAMLTTEAARMATNMQGLAGASSLVRTGMYAATSAFTPFLGQIGMAVTAVAGLVAVFALKKKRIEDNTEALRKNISELTKLAGTGDKLAKTLALKDLLAAEEALRKKEEEIREELLKGAKTEQQRRVVQKIMGEVILRQTVEERNRIDALRKAYEELNKATKDILTNRLKWEAEHNAWALEAYRNHLQEKLKGVEKWSDDYINSLKRIEEINKQIRERDLEYNKSYVFKLEQSTKDYSDYVFKAGEHILKQKQKAYNQMMAEEERFRAGVLSYVNQFSVAWVDTFRGVEGAFGQMLQNMVAQLAQVALSSMIMSMFFPGMSFMSFFKAGMGFQYGTPYVPKTGMYMLERGEAITPASRNISYIRNYSTGGGTQNYYLLNLDVDKLTRKSIVPTIERMARNRQTKILVV